MRHVAQSQCAKVGRGHGLVCAGGGCSDSGTGTGAYSTRAQWWFQIYIYIYTYRQDQQQTCLRVTLTHILFINIAQKQLIFGNIPISNVWMLVVCIGSVRTTTKAKGRPADCSNSSHKMLLPTPPHSSLPAPALQVLRPSRLLLYVQPESTETAAAAAAAQPSRAIA